MNKKIIVVSNEPFSDSSSNGRTLKNFLLNIPKECIAQFYLHGTPDREFCNNYFCISDGDALRAFLHKRKHVDGQSAKQTAEGSVSVKPKRSYRNLVLRNIVWQSMQWWHKDFTAFLDDFGPEIVLLQAGDSPFMYMIALKIARRYHAKLMMYNSESYVLKKVMYATSGKPSVWHTILMSSLKAQYRRFMKHTDFCIYNTKSLERAYQERYPHPGRSCTLYTTSEMDALPDHSGDTFRLLYCGNLGAGRVQPIDELAKSLFEIDQSAKLDIYGRFPSMQAQEMICGNPNVEFHGFVDYQEVPKLMSQASMLVHCENNERVENLRYAFSTKIADSLASARPFLVYASLEYPFVQYLEKNRCAHIASNKDELKAVIKKCLESKQYLYQYTDNAQYIASQYHGVRENIQKIQEIFNLL